MEVKNEYSEVVNALVTSFLPFGSTYMCEKTFSAMAIIKSKQRNCLQLESDLVLVVSNVSPWTEKLMSGKKTHVSH
jgi:hypothetical protein